MLTEAEAASKRCPFTFGPPSQNTSAMGVMGAGGFISMMPPPSPTHCIGSYCMAWRWLWSVHDGLDEHDRAADGKPLGYCGLVPALAAPKPEGGAA